jgi:hypothetical protein
MAVHSFGIHSGFTLQADHFSDRGKVHEEARWTIRRGWDREAIVYFLNPGQACVSKL